MRLIMLKPAALAVMPAALAALIKDRMRDRVNACLEDREAAQAAVDVAVETRRQLAGLDDVPGGAVLVIGSGSFPGLMQIDQAVDELFGPGLAPAVLTDAVRAHSATLAAAMAAAAYVGGHAEELLEAAKELLEAFGGDTPHFIRPEAMRLQEAVDNLEACAEPSMLTQEALDGAVERGRKWMPGLASWIATILSLRDKAVREEAALEITAPYGERQDGSPRGLEECE